MARILVVDDDPDLLLLMHARLGARGHEVLTAASCSEALTQAAARLPDLMLLDYCMPRMDGGRMIELLRADALTRRLPVIVMTAASTAWVSGRLPPDPLIRVLEKPFDFPVLDALMREFLPAARAR
jgi:CheY-like chemotaxis protein